MISYDILEKTLKDKGIGKTELSTRLGLSTRTIAKIGKGEKLSARSLRKIGDYGGCASSYPRMEDITDSSGRKGYEAAGRTISRVAG